jgi:hypothetical protein
MRTSRQEERKKPKATIHQRRKHEHDYHSADEGKKEQRAFTSHAQPTGRESCPEKPDTTQELGHKQVD